MDDEYHNSDIWGIIPGILLILIIFGILFLMVYSTFQYWDLKEVIKRCDKDFGVGNWTFTETKEAYICKSYKQESYVTSSVQTFTTKQCFENGIEVKC